MVPRKPVPWIWPQRISPVVLFWAWQGWVTGGRGSTVVPVETAVHTTACALFQPPSASRHAQDPDPSSWLSFSHCGAVTQGEASQLPVLDQNYLSHKIPVWTQTNLYYISSLDADISLTCPASTSPALSGSCPQLVLIPFVLLGDLGRAGASLERVLSAAFHHLLTKPFHQEVLA